jgi:hypothetical protein
MAIATGKAVDKSLSRVKKAIDKGENPLSEAEVDFVQTCCRILGIDSKEKIDSIGKRAIEGGKGNMWKTMKVIPQLLDELRREAKRHKRELPGPSLTTRALDDMDSLSPSFLHLEAIVKGVRDAMTGGFARGIKIARHDLKNSMEGFWVTVERTGMATKWDEAVVNDWIVKGRIAFLKFCFENAPEKLAQ